MYSPDEIAWLTLDAALAYCQTPGTMKSLRKALAYDGLWPVIATAYQAGVERGLELASEEEW